MRNFNDFFINVESGATTEEKLQKALCAGYGTDSATFTGGREIIPE